MSAVGDVLGVTEAGAPLRLDLDRLIGTHLCAVANSGGGKSGLIRRLLETTHGRVQQIVLDVEDEFYTLRERFDYVIAGGEGGDAPATVANAPGLATAALSHGFSLVVQLNDLGPDGAPEFVGRFLQAMIAAPRELWRPVLVVLDEAQRFAPQDGSTAATAGVKALTAQGRKRGFTAVLASQRIAKIDADVRGDVNNWLLGRVGQSLDRRTVADALGFAPSSAEARELQGLPDRNFWGFGPALAREPVLFRVADVETTPVKPGQAKVATPPAPEALRAILAGLANAPEPEQSAEPDAERADVVAEQRDRIAQLAAEVEQFKRLGDALYTRGLVAGIERARAGLEQLAATAAHGAETPPVDAETVAALDRAMRDVPSATKPPGRADGLGPKRPTPPSAPEKTAQARKMIEALARHYPRALPIEHVAAIADVSVKSSQWRRNLQSFVDSSLVKPFTRQGWWEMSTAGRDAFGLAHKPDDPGALLEFWTRAFPPSTGAILRAIVEAGRPLSRAEVAQAAGVSPTSSGLGGGLKELRDHGLIVTTGDRHRAAEVLL